MVGLEDHPAGGDDRFVTPQGAERADERGAQQRPLLVLARLCFETDGIEDRGQQSAGEGGEGLPVLLPGDEVEEAEGADDEGVDVRVPFGAKASEQGEEGGELPAPGEGHRPDVGDEVVALAGAEFLDPSEQLALQLLVVGEAVEAGAAGVQHDRASDPLHRRRLAAEEQTRLLRVVESPRDHGHDPVAADGGVAGRLPTREIGEGLCEELDLAFSCPGARGRAGAALEDPAVHDLANRLARLGLDRVPQVGRLGVGVLVGREIATHAGTEALTSEVGLEHPQDAAPFS